MIRIDPRRRENTMPPPSSSPLVIAEAGVNHNGDLARALEMVDAAAEAGADVVKFQAFRAEDLVAAGAPTARYQKDNTGEGDQIVLLRELELDLAAFAAIADACAACGIEFLATAFDVDVIEDLVDLGMRRIKVASGEITNMPAIRRFAGLALPMIISTGMATEAEIDAAVTTAKGAGAADITLLQCTSLYPAPPESLNLRAMQGMSDSFGLPVGFSDHSLGDTAAIAAVALGASVVEKHFTLDRSLPGPDHSASLEPDELASMIGKLKEIGILLGDGKKTPSAAEQETAALVRRSWHAACDLSAGTVLAEDHIVLKRPADGLSPSVSLVGRQTARSVGRDAPITAADIAGAGQ